MSRVPDQHHGTGADPGIAVVGLAGRFPGAPSVAALWRQLLDGVEGVRDFTAEEITDASKHTPLVPADDPEATLIRRRGILDDVDRFDAPFFGINPREAELLDPQHRLFLEVAAQALDDAGHPDERDGHAIGVYAGASMSSYLLHHVVPHLQQRGFDAAWQMVLGNDKDHLATRVAYLLGLTGPAVLVQTACSTSLVAVHMARRALLAGECDLALAGGAAVRVPQTLPLRYQPGGINAPDGHCRPFDAQAQGTVGGNGVAAVVLRRLDDALADGDTIHAVIRGSAINNDGHHKVGYTAPSVEGQAQVVRAALDEAGFDPATLGFVEAHGTGTTLGDPIEVRALHRAWDAAQLDPDTCALGSLKGNLGHLDTASGIAGLIKAVLAVEHGIVPPTLHLATPSPRIPWNEGPFFVPNKVTEWPKPDGPRRAAVSSFGLGGTNAHVVLEQAPLTLALSPGGRGDQKDPETLSTKAPATTPTEVSGVGGESERKRSVPLHRTSEGHQPTEVRPTPTEPPTAEGVGERTKPTPDTGPSSPGTSISAAAPPLTLALSPGGRGNQKGDRKGPFTLVLSAKTPTALAKTAKHLADHLEAHPGLDLADVAFTLAVGRRAHSHRRVIDVTDTQHAVEALRGDDPSAVRESVVEPRDTVLAPDSDPATAIDHWLQGGTFDAQGPFQGRRIPLPPTQFDDHRFWLAPTPVASTPATPSIDAATWRREPQAPTPGPRRPWRILGSNLDNTDALVAALEPVADGVAHGLDPQSGEALLILGPGWPDGLDADQVAELTQDHDGPWWWLTRGHDPIDSATDSDATCPLVLGELGHRLDLDPDLPDTNLWYRVANELTAEAPLRRGALVGRFRWSRSLSVDEQALLSLDTTVTPDEADTASSRSHLSTPYAAPQTDFEQQLVTLWEDLLGTHPIGIHDDFFELGGHSLLATQAMARTRQLTGTSVALETLFDAPTIAALAAHCEAGDSTADNNTTDPISELPPLVAQESRDGAPLSFAQQRLWFLDRLDPGNPAYNLNATTRLDGQLDIQSLRRALAKLAKRQASLRTRFELSGSELRQHLDPVGPVPLPIVDLSALPENLRQREGQRLAQADKHHRFDLARGPLWTVGLLRLAPESHELLVALHHSIADGWSVGLLLAELAELYAADLEGRTAALPPLPIQVGDYARWQRDLLRNDADGANEGGAVVQRELAYWLQQLDGLSPEQDLPSDRPRPAEQTFRAGQEALELSPELSAQLNALARSLPGVTPFMVLLATLDILLSRQLGSTDLAVGSPVAGREHVETENLVGCFLNTLVLRVDVGGNPSFRQLVDRVRTVAQGAFAHQRLPFEQLLEALQPERDLSRTPLFRVFLNVLNLPAQERHVPGLVLRPTSTPELSSKFDITLYVAERDDRLRLVWVYNADLFDSTRIACMAGQFAGLLRQVVDDPDQAIDSLQLRGPGEDRLLADPEAPLDTTFHGTVTDLVATAVARGPKRPAVVGHDIAWTYADLDRRVTALAERLLNAGLEPGEPVAVLAHRSPPLVVAVLAILRAGGVFSLYDPAYPAPRLVSMLRLAQPRVWIALDDAGPVPASVVDWLAEAGLRSQINLPAAAELADRASAGDRRPVPRGADDPACIAFTSGTTGAKAVLGKQGALTHFLPWQQITFELSADDRFSMLSGLAHDPLQRDLFTPLVLGATLVIPEPGALDNPNALADWMAQSQIHVAHLTPAMGQLLTQSQEDTAPGETPEPDAAPRLPDLHRVFFIGDRLRRHDVARLEAMAPAVRCVNFYGTTETQRASGFYPVPPGQRQVLQGSDRSTTHEVLPLGQGTPGAQLLVLDRLGRPAGVGEVGEIVVRSPHLALGYLGDPELTAERFRGDRYTTGDLGRASFDGTVRFVGRADQQLKIRGFRIEPGEVEGALLALTGVAEAVVVGREDVPGEPRLVAYLVAHEGTTLKPADLRRALRQRVPAALVPSAFVVLDALPRTPNFKIDRRALPAPPKDRSVSDQPFEAPRNNKEKRLARVFEELLGVDTVGIHDDFFALGGHSLSMMQLVARVQEMAGVDLPLARVYRQPTVAALAQAIVDLQEYTLLSARDAPGSDTLSDAVLVPLQPEGTRPPLFLVHPGGGHLLDYRALAQELAPDQPLYGLQAPGVSDAATAPLDAIGAMAERYLDALHRVAPQGPYHLAGYCTGGLVAFEMARRLRARGETVAWLGILDTVARRERRDADPRWVEGVATYYFAAELGLRVTAEELRAWPPETWGDALWNLFEERSAEAAAQLGEPLYRRLYRVFLAIRRASWDYVPEPYDGPLTLFVPRLASEELASDPTLLGWRGLAPEIEVHRVPGSHTTMLKPPQVRELARRLRQSLEQGTATMAPLEPARRLSES